MTREEAIFYIKELQKTYASMDKKVAEAVDMAIEALSAEPSDLISRADAIDAVRYLIYDRQEKGAKPFKWWFIKQRLNAIPSADRPQGEWKVDEKHTEEIYTHPVVCSECGQDVVIEWGEFTPYCPNCGARMENTK